MLVLNKKIILSIILLFFTFTSITKAQQNVDVVGVNPFIMFWVTTNPYSNTATTTLDVRDSSVLDMLTNLYRETLRNNFWLMDKLGIKAEKDQGLEKAKIQTLTNELDQEFINWVNYGFNNGNPAYITNSGAFYQAVSNRVRNDFVETLNKYFPEGTEGIPSFMEDIKKVLARDIDKTIQPDEETTKTIMSWDEWKDQEMYLNPSMIYGSLKTKLDKAEEEAIGSYQTELSEGNGFLSYKKCTVSYADANDNISQDCKDVITFYGDLNYYSKNLWEETQEGKKYENKVPVVNCTVLTPGRVIYDKLSSINMSKDQILRMNAALTNGKDSLLDGIKDELETYQTKVLSKGVFSITASDTDKINQKIKENSEILASSTGGNLKIDRDLSNPRNTDSPYYPGKILTDDEWKKVWQKENPFGVDMSEEESIITDAPGWYDKNNYIFGDSWDKWKVLNIFEPEKK